MAVLKYYKNGEWSKVNAPSAAVTSVNGQTGDVVIEMPEVDYPVTSVNGMTGDVTIEMPEVDYPVTSVNGQTGDVVIDTGADIPISNTAPENPEVGDLWLDTTTGISEEDGYVASFNGRGGVVEPQAGDYTAEMIGLGDVDNIRQYSANNPPPYPVTSVNGKTGAVEIEMPETPTLSELSGVLPVANGGTGVTNLSELATAMGANPDLNGRIQVGYYMGTGKSGSSNPNSITFNFVPKYLFISMPDRMMGYSGSIYRYSNYNYIGGSFPGSSAVVDSTTNANISASGSTWVDLTTVSTSYSNSSGLGFSVTFNSFTSEIYNKIVGNTLSWYWKSSNNQTNASAQYNTSNQKYYYIAIG